MLKLVELIGMSGVDLGKYKVHCATKSVPTDKNDPFFGGSGDPLDAFFDGRFKEWQSYQTKPNFECEHVVALIQLRDRVDEWLFAGAYEIMDKEDRLPWKKKGVTYQTQLVPGLNHLDGRAIVHFPKNFRQPYLLGENYGADLLVNSIRSERMTTGEFPGFNKALRTFSQLRTIVREKNPSWRAALSSVTGIYVITDSVDGRQYVGCADGQEGIWQRWVSYAATGHGGNKELKALLRKHGADYAANWQIAILEVCDLNAGQDDIHERESYWKDALLTREHGLNAN